MAMSSSKETPTKSSGVSDVDPSKPDTTVASEDAANAIVSASPLNPDADRVAMVSRDKNGNPHQSENFEVMVHPDASDRQKAAAHNTAGEALGAKHVTAKENS